MGPFPSLKSSRDSPNKFEWIGLAQKNKNVMNAIFGHFDLMQWREAKAREGSNPYPFEEVTDCSKIPLILVVKILQLKRNFKNNMPGSTEKIENISNKLLTFEKKWRIMFNIKIQNSKN